MHKFTSEKERLELLEGFEQKAKKLSEREKTSIYFETTSTLDEVGKESGVLYVAFVRKPHIMVAIKAFDMIAAQRKFEAGFFLWDITVIKEESSSDFESDDALKIGMCGRIGANLEIQAPDIKKK